MESRNTHARTQPKALDAARLILSQQLSPAYGAYKKNVEEDFEFALGSLQGIKGTSV